MSMTIGTRIFSAIAHSAQLKLGQDYQIVAVTDISPVMTEMILTQKNSGQMFGGRVYHLEPDLHATVRDYWSSEAYMLDGLVHEALNRPIGLRTVGQELVFLYEWRQGVGLDRLMKRVGCLPANFSTRIAIETLKALESVYARGAAHFQLKPSDVLLGYDGSISLRNYGLYDFELQVAKLLGLSSLFDIRYVSPEHLLGTEMTVSCDLYSLGVLLFELVTGRLPFDGDFDAIRKGHLEVNPPNAQSINQDVNLGLSRIMARAMSKDPQQRFMHLSEFKQALAFMLPAGERDDVLATPGAAEAFWSEADVAKIDHDLNMANRMAANGEIERAVQSIDAVLMAFPGHEGAKMLRRQFQNQLFESRIEGVAGQVEQPHGPTRV